MAELLHLTERRHWRAAQQAGTFRMSTRGTTLEEEGFIHCSLPHQVDAVATMLYGHDAAAHDLVLLVIDSDLVDHPVRYEAMNPGGEEFPHIYGPLPITAVTDIRPWTWPDSPT